MCRRANASVRWITCYHRFHIQERSYVATERAHCSAAKSSHCTLRCIIAADRHSFLSLFPPSLFLLFPLSETWHLPASGRTDNEILMEMALQTERLQNATGLGEEEDMVDEEDEEAAAAGGKK
jgi:hypothetical protein